MNQVRITLEKPFLLKQGEEQPLVLRYGTSQPKMIAVAAGNIAGQDAQGFVDAGSFLDLEPRQVRKMKPGEPIIYSLLASDPKMKSIIVAAEMALTLFGDWRITRERSASLPPEYSFNSERDRIARRWGWYQLPRLTQGGLTNTRHGQDPADQTKIGVPRIPHVFIEDVDERGNIGMNLQFRPWDHFTWEADVISLEDPQTSPVSLQSFTIEDLRKILAEHDAKHDTAKKATTKGA